MHIELHSYLVYDNFAKELNIQTTFISEAKSNHRRCSVKKGVLRNLANFTGKHLCQSLFFKKVAGGLQLY